MCPRTISEVRGHGLFFQFTFSVQPPVSASPWAFSPKTRTLPSERTTAKCVPPAAMATAPETEEKSTESLCRKKWAQIRPSASSARIAVPLADTATMSCQAERSNAVDMTRPSAITATA